MRFFSLVLASIIAVAATTALPLHDNLPNDISPRQDSSCAAAMSLLEATRKKDQADSIEYENNPTIANRNEVAKNKQDLKILEKKVVSIVVLLM